MIGNKIEDKIKNISKKPVKELSNNNNDEKEEDVEITTHKKDIYRQKKDKKL